MAFAHLSEFKRFSPEKYQKHLVLATERSTLDVYCLLAGQSQKPHAHAGNDKYYLILEGRGRVRIGNDERDLGPGEVALAAAGTEHGIANPGPDPLVAAVFQAPRAH